MKGNLSAFIKSLEEERDRGYKALENRSKFLDYLKSFPAKIYGIDYKEDRVVAFTSDYGVPLDFEIKTLGFRVDEIDHGPYEKRGFVSKEYSRVFDFFDKKVFGDLEFYVYLKDKEIEDKRMNVVFDFLCGADLGGQVIMPHRVEEYLDFYSSRGMKPSLLAKLKNFLLVAKEVVVGDGRS